jgi:membrane protein
MRSRARRPWAWQTVIAIRAALASSYRDGCLGTAKGAAYSGLLSFFPLLATIASILVRFRADFVARQMTVFLSEILPPGTDQLVFYYFTVKGRQPVLLPVTGAILSVWAASGALVSLMEGFRAAYRIPTGRTFVRQRIVALLLVVSAVIPLLGASALMLFGARVERAIVHALGLLPAGAVELRGWVLVIGTLIRDLVALGAIILGATLLYYFGPNRKQRWGRVWPGAVVATTLWFAATLLFAWYVRNIANYNVIYGSITAVILLLVWMYVLAVIALFGCQFNAARERLGG